MYQKENFILLLQVKPYIIKYDMNFFHKYFKRNENSFKVVDLS